MTTRAEIVFTSVIVALQAGLPPLVPFEHIFRENEFELDDANDLPRVSVFKSGDTNDGNRDIVTEKRVLRIQVDVDVAATSSAPVEAIREAIYPLLRALNQSAGVEEVRETNVSHRRGQLSATTYGATLDFEIDYVVPQNIR